MRMLDISPYCWEKMVLTMGAPLLQIGGPTAEAFAKFLGINGREYITKHVM